MRAYRLYRIDGAGKFWAADWIEADGDEQAVIAARELKRRSRCEVWQGSRLVARLDVDPPSSVGNSEPG